jgi:DNA-binding response OmpR family regulator
MHILYVEDNNELREAIGALMEEEGRTVICCATAEEALGLDARHHFDVVVADVSLPGKSGTDLARELLATDPNRWIVLCSGYDLGKYPAEWGPRVRTLMKPFEVEDLDALLAEIQQSIRA